MCPWSIFCSRGTPPREGNPLSQPTLSLSHLEDGAPPGAWRGVADADQEAPARAQGGVGVARAGEEGVGRAELGGVVLLGALERLVFYCRTTSASTAPCTPRRMCCPTHCASYCAPCQPLLRAFSGWIRAPPPTAGQKWDTRFYRGCLSWDID